MINPTIGPVYKLRDGRTAVIMQLRIYKCFSSMPEDYGAPRELQYWGGIILENGEPCSWGTEGRYSPIGYDHALDLVAIDGVAN